ncbi:unnamed protein product [Linum trigynum]|uniref:Uncharacterized protein n=1 Tax=Linum trigynum TaxID=586398 RepID=A0AAV2GT97_9ROSI
MASETRGMAMGTIPRGGSDSVFEISTAPPEDDGTPSATPRRMINTPLDPVEEITTGGDVVRRHRWNSVAALVAKSLQFQRWISRNMRGRRKITFFAENNLDLRD